MTHLYNLEHILWAKFLAVSSWCSSEKCFFNSIFPRKFFKTFFNISEYFIIPSCNVEDIRIRYQESVHLHLPILLWPSIQTGEELGDFNVLLAVVLNQCVYDIG